MQKKYNILFGSTAKNIFFSIYNSLCDYKMHYGKIMNEVMIIVKFATSKLGILYSWLCFFKPSNCHHQGLFAFCNHRRRCFRYVSLCIFFQLWMNCIYNVIFVKMKSPNNMLNSVVQFLFWGHK